MVLSFSGSLSQTAVYSAVKCSMVCVGWAALRGWVGGVMVLLVGVSGVVVVNVGGESVGVVVFGAVLRV